MVARGGTRLSEAENGHKVHVEALFADAYLDGRNVLDE
jgi:hypothetical protein